MSKKLIINCDSREIRVGAIENERLVDLYIQRPENQRVVGNIYKGRVENVLPGMQAAFIDIGLEKNAFLYVDDAVPTNHSGGANNPTNLDIQNVLRQGQEIVVQVIKEPFGTKGARVSTNINIPGRYVVLMPLSKYIGISRKIEMELERERLRTISEGLFGKEQMGLIVRTVADGVTDRQLEVDYLYLKGLWEKVQKNLTKVKTPGLVHRDLEILPRVIRDVFTEDVNEVVIDTYEDYVAIVKIIESIAPHKKSCVTHYKGKDPIFHHYLIEQELDKALKQKVWLKSGGYLIIDHTEALTVIDVNTGKFVGQSSLEETVVTTNVEAAREVAFQLRLRNISGIIIVDFIDMHIEGNQQKVLRVLEEELKKDRNKTHLLGITKLGLVEITRKKVRKSLNEFIMGTCQTCHGTGKTWSKEATTNKIDREVRHFLRYSKDDAIVIELHEDIVSEFKGEQEEHIHRLEDEFGKRIFIRIKKHVPLQHFNIVFSGEVRDATRIAKLTNFN
ncbi:hypothetical protein BHU72_12630 [Desulfuribacillus stibiiarsenatis]|uniref:Ribonuclease G n=1 Tax=Desulfuribacillus stibiiarsenatis TaxID=1390249 RepID=A0A1E5L2I1_9FIRM|nr:Rne/Rng family ribonuclease [Desulfuribacillus stibiiarsenatis]OEH84243.1 hypothetical protein BHU72_12630 [Desulfuribacillus stibiiarsenatis]